MKMLKFALIGAAFVGFCSFVWVKQIQMAEKLPIDQEVYHKFLSKFKKVDLPYTVSMPRFNSQQEYFNNEANVITVSDEAYLGREFGEILPDIQRGMMSRMGPDDYAAEVLLAENKNFNAVIYARLPSFRGSKTYYVATFDKKGKLIGRMNIASQNYSSIEEATISKNLVINVEKYNIEGLDGTNEENKLSYNHSTSKKFAIDEHGKIVEQTVPKVAPQTQQKKATKGGDLGAVDKLSPAESSVWDF